MIPANSKSCKLQNLVTSLAPYIIITLMSDSYFGKFSESVCRKMKLVRIRIQFRSFEFSFIYPCETLRHVQYAVFVKVF